VLDYEQNVFNWTFNQVTRFLNKNGFLYTHTKGSHYYYTGIQNHETRIVAVPYSWIKINKAKNL
jgi:predicted RNA binding protein YcfA (HicA-like mRNA interferase family)